MQKTSSTLIESTPRFDMRRVFGHIAVRKIYDMTEKFTEYRFRDGSGIKIFASGVVEECEVLRHEAPEFI